MKSFSDPSNQEGSIVFSKNTALLITKGLRIQSADRSLKLFRTSIELSSCLGLLLWSLGTNAPTKFNMEPENQNHGLGQYLSSGLDFQVPSHEV